MKSEAEYLLQNYLRERQAKVAPAWQYMLGEHLERLTYAVLTDTEIAQIKFLEIANEDTNSLNEYTASTRKLRDAIRLKYNIHRHDLRITSHTFDKKLKTGEIKPFSPMTRARAVALFYFNEISKDAQPNWKTP